jgi:hypothetical protein
VVIDGKLSAMKASLLAGLARYRSRSSPCGQDLFLLLALGVQIFSSLCSSILKNTDELPALFSRMNPSEKEAFRLGTHNAL